jgi:chromosome segregation ATPase
MQKINGRLILSLAALLVVCGASLSGGTVLARDGESGSGSGSGTSGRSSTEVEHDAVTTTTAHETETETETEQETAKTQTLRDQFKQEAKTKVQTEVKAKAQVKTTEQKQKACEARKTNLTKRMDNSVAAAQRHKDNFDKIYAKVVAFQTSKNLTVANYASLKAAADAASSDATAKIAALKALNVTVDCTQTDSLASNITAFQTAVKSTRDSLKDYRKTIVALITALHDANGTKTEDSSTKPADQ